MQHMAPMVLPDIPYREMSQEVPIYTLNDESPIALVKVFGSF